MIQQVKISIPFLGRKSEAHVYVRCQDNAHSDYSSLPSMSGRDYEQESKKSGQLSTLVRTKPCSQTHICPISLVSLSICAPPSLSHIHTPSLNCSTDIMNFAKIRQGKIDSDLSFQLIQYQWEICHVGVCLTATKTSLTESGETMRSRWSINSPAWNDNLGNAHTAFYLCFNLCLPEC